MQAKTTTTKTRTGKRKPKERDIVKIIIKGKCELLIT